MDGSCAQLEGAHECLREVGLLHEGRGMHGCWLLSWVRYHLVILNSWWGMNNLLIKVKVLLLLHLLLREWNIWIEESSWAVRL